MLLSIYSYICSMQKHTEIYLDYYGYDETDFIGCEVCGKPAVDCHGSKFKNRLAQKIHKNNL